MAVQGQRHGHTKNDISDSIIENNGNIVDCCLDLNISRETFYKLLRVHPDLWDLVEQERKVYVKYKKKSEVDLALRCIHTLVENFEENPTVAANSAWKILDKNDEEYGYKENAIQNTYTNDKQLDDGNENMELKATIAKLEAQLKKYEKNDNKP